jgi:hypothetical protein
MMLAGCWRGASRKAGGKGTSQAAWCPSLQVLCGHLSSRDSLSLQNSKLGRDTILWSQAHWPRADTTALFSGFRHLHWRCMVT